MIPVKHGRIICKSYTKHYVNSMMKRIFRISISHMARLYYHLLFYFTWFYDRPVLNNGACLACGEINNRNRVVTTISAGEEVLLYFRRKLSRILISASYLRSFRKAHSLLVAQRSILGRRIWIQYYCCWSCESNYQGLAPRSDEIKNRISEFYGTFYRSGTYEYGRIEWLENPRFLRWRDFILRTVKLNGEHSGKTILDCGCGEGILGSLLEKKGFVTHGIDANLSMINFAINTLALPKERYKSEPYEIDLYPRKSFDFVTSYHVIEHVSDPIRFLSTIYFHLKPNGLAFISTPSAHLSEQAINCEGKSVNYNPLHIFLLSKHWFEIYAERIGFEIKFFGSNSSISANQSPSADGEKLNRMHFILKKAYR